MGQHLGLSASRLMLGLVVLAILIHGVDANTGVTCAVFEGGEKGGTRAVHSFPNICTRPADNSLPEWPTTFEGTEKRSFRLTEVFPTLWTCYSILKQQNRLFIIHIFG